MVPSNFMGHGLTTIFMGPRNSRQDYLGKCKRLEEEDKIKANEITLNFGFVFWFGSIFSDISNKVNY